ncbi:hypothetical protein CMK11_16500 [Candidatus Poribacteria bacterium]|nr:hypothetical protein [Candidatus Poribacteria bacterium]
MSPRRLRRLLLCLAALVLVSGGCASYSMQELRGSLASGDYGTSLEQLKADPDLSLPYLLEVGLVAHYAGEFDQSNAAFEIAEYIAEDLYTRHISREAAALLTSDTVRPYAGTRYERLLIHYYRALNYVYLGLPDDALVEVRRAGSLLRSYADADDKYEFAGAAFFAYFSGILYEWAGDWNDAYIAYRWAETGYVRYSDAYGVRPPGDIGHRLVRLARGLGFDDDAEKYVELYGEPPDVPDGWGEIVLFHESGYAPRKFAEDIILPILSGDEFVEREVWSFADTVVERRHITYEDAELEYLLRVALPSYASERPTLTRMDVGVADQSVSATRVEDLDRVMTDTFESEQGTVLLRTAARSLLKYLAYRRAKKKNAVAGWLVNAFNVASEVADTRSWQTLPCLISVARVPVPPGTHDVRMAFSDAGGRGRRTETLPGVTVAPGDTAFWNVRTFD